MLGFTVQELAEKAGISIWEAFFLDDFPDFLLREDIKQRIYGALLARPGWARIGYGPELTKQRLYRYLSPELDIADVLLAIGLSEPTPEQIEEWPEERQAIVVRLIEEQLRTGLDESSK